MNSELYLQIFASCLQQVEKNSFVQLYDKSLNFIFAGDKFTNLLGLTNNAIINKNIYEIEPDTNYFSMLFRDRLAFLSINHNQCQEHSFTSLVKLDEGLTILYNKVIIIRYKKKFLGICIKPKLVNPLSEIEILSNYINHTYISADVVGINPKDEFNPIELTESEDLVLYFLLKGKQDKEIAHILGEIKGKSITREAISKMVIRNLFPMFKANSRSSLISNAQNSKYFLKKLPRLLVLSQS